MEQSCSSCKFAEWGYTRFPDSPKKYWFIIGCKRDCPSEYGSDCLEYEEFEEEDDRC